jgi:RNA polymerase sigma-70 factor (ECF subfamily)
VERPDAELVAAARAGDPAAFGDLVARYQRSVLASARHLVGDADDAEDVAQESFVQAFRSLRKLREPERFRAWLYGILRRISLKHLSRRGWAVLVSHEQVADAPITADPDNGRDTALLAELRRLPTSYREVLAARYLQGLTYREIAQALGTSEGNIRIRCLRARQRLRAILAEADGPSTGAAASDATPTPGGCAGKE